MDQTRKELLKYLAEIKRVRGKFSFFPDLFAFINKKGKRKLSDKLKDLESSINNVSLNEEDYKKSVVLALQGLPENLPCQVRNIVDKIKNDLNIMPKTANSYKVHDEKDNEKIGEYIKNISCEVGKLSGYKSWFFQSPNFANEISQLWEIIVESIKNSAIDPENRKIKNSIQNMKKYIFNYVKESTFTKNDNHSELKFTFKKIYENLESLNKLLFGKNFELFPDYLSQALEIQRCLKHISKNIKDLNRHKSWFFKKDNSAKIIYNLSKEVVKSIENSIINNKSNVSFAVNVHSDLSAMKDYILDALKLRMIEKKLHDNDSDAVKSILISLYTDFGYLSELIFCEEFEEIPQTFIDLVKPDTLMPKSLKDNKESKFVLKYYIRLMESDLKKLSKKKSSKFRSKYNEAKRLYEALFPLFRKIKKIYKNSNNDKLKTLFEPKKYDKIISDQIDGRTSRLEKECRSTFNDKTLKIMYNLYNDFSNFYYIIGGKKFAPKSMDKYFEVDRESLPKDRTYTEQKEINGKLFLKSNVEKIKGTIIFSMFVMELAKVIVTVEGTKFAGKFAQVADIDDTYSIFLSAETNIDCKFFEIKGSGAIKIRVYLALGTFDIIKYIKGITNTSLINFDAFKDIDAKLNVKNNLSAGSIYFLPYKSNVENSDVGKSNKINTKLDAGKAILTLKDIKIQIQKFKTTFFSISLKSKIEKKLYDSLYKIYKNLARAIKSASGSEDEIVEIINLGRKFTINESSKINTNKKLNKKIKSQFSSDLLDLFKKFSELKSSLLQKTYSLESNEIARSDISSEQIMKSLGGANIYGEVLSSVPLLQEEVKQIKFLENEKLSEVHSVAGKHNPGYMIFTVENASVKGIIPENDYTFNESKIKGSIVACVADLTVNADLNDFIAKGESWFQKIKNYGAKTMINKLKNMDNNTLSGKIFKKGVEWTKKFASKNSQGYLNALGMVNKTLREGIRIRVYLSFNSVLKSVVKLAKISQNMKKGKVKLFR